MIPSVAAVAALYPLAAFASFVFLVPLAFLMGLFLIPIFSVMRQALSVLVSVDRRRLAFSADSVVAEASFIIGPATGVLVVTQFGASAALAAIGLSEATAGAMLLRLNPPLRRVTETPETPSSEATAGPREPWMSAQVGFLFLISGGAVITLIATDLGVVAVLEKLASAAALALAVIPTGFLCAPTLTATAEWITELTPEDRRGERSAGTAPRSRWAPRSALRPSACRSTRSARGAASLSAV